jgi:hypothetical protein
MSSSRKKKKKVLRENFCVIALPRWLIEAEKRFAARRRDSRISRRQRKRARRGKFLLT